MAMNVKIFLTLIFTTLFCFAELKPEDLLPKDDDIKNWKISDETSCQKIIIKTPDELIVLIDGGADVYNKKGFKNGAFDGYKGGADDMELCVEIFNQDKAGNAVTLFEELSKGWKDIGGIGDAARLDETGLFTLGLVFVVKNFFV